MLLRLERLRDEEENDCGGADMAISAEVSSSSSSESNIVEGCSVRESKDGVSVSIFSWSCRGRRMFPGKSRSDVRLLQR